MINWHIGCSGFHYKHWKGSFYPENLAKSKWFEYYCRFFNTLELNVTFYRFPQLSVLESWNKKSPENFHFAVKAPRAITHYKKFLGTTDMISDFYGIIREGLKEKLGCVLFQMPPQYTYSEERLERIINSLDNSFLNVVEFRSADWWQESVFKIFGKQNISFCGMSHPNLPKDIISNAPLLYYRFHGEGELYASDYNHTQLEESIKRIRSEKEITDAYLFFNNDIHTYAVYNAIETMKIVST